MGLCGIGEPVKDDPTTGVLTSWTRDQALTDRLCLDLKMGKKRKFFWKKIREAEKEIER